MAKVREFKCKECGKTFGDFRALGGHVREHRKPGAQQPAQGIPDLTQAGAGTAREAPPVQAIQAGAGSATATIQAGGQPAQPQPSQEEEPDKAESIRKLLQKGFSPRQIKEQFGYARTTVDEVAADFLKAEMNSEGSKADARGELMPVKLGAKEIIPPEAIMRELGLDGDENGKKILEGVALVLLGARMHEHLAIIQANTMAPMIEMIRALREEEKVAAEHARGEGQLIAQAAAEGTAGRVMSALEPRLAALEQKKPDIASVPNPLMGVMARALETSLTPLLSNLMGAFVPGGAQQGQAQQGPALPSGWSFKEE